MPMRPSYPQTTPQSVLRRFRLLIAAVITAALALLAVSIPAPAQDLEDQVANKRAELEEAKQKEGVLTTEISRYDDQIDQLTGEVAMLRNREAIVQQELDVAEEQLVQEQENLRIARERLDRSVDILSKRLVAIYKSESPDALTVVLESDGFEDVLGQYEYLQRIQDQDSSIVTRVRDLRDDTRATVERVRVTRDSIAAKKRELERTRIALEAREAELSAARAKSRSALDRVGGHADRLEENIEGLEEKIQAQLAAAAAESSGTAPLPAGPIQGGSSGMIWPVNGPVVSPFGPRWGSMHNGVDIAVPAGTPIRAAQSGSIAFAQSDAESGGYGNFTCVDHGGGLSTCYAHQSSFAITSGSVSQGDVIGYVGCTGHCYGDHLHFEVRINGVATDPMAYL
jgi:murein DD-endopeptidase MepM/ murein hydrolase activator NlpD